MAHHLICELAPWEAELWREKGVKPDCRQHRHVSKMEACEKTCHGDFREHARAIASWVGPRQIMLTADRVWRPEASDGVAVMQLVPGTALQKSSPRAPQRFTPRGLPSIRARKDSRARRSLLFSVS